MLEQRNRKVDLIALALMALAVFLALTLFTYDPADPPGANVYPQREHVSNLCGRSGAWAAHLLLEGLGLGAYYLLLSLIVLDGLLVAHRPIQDRGLRVVGWSLSLLGLTTLSALAIPQLSPGPVIGSGGYLGAIGRALLEMNFASVGAYLVAISLLLVGVLLATDYAVPKLLARLSRTPLAGVRRLIVRRPAAVRKTTDLEEDDLPNVAVRIGGKPVDEATKVAAADDEEPAVAEVAATDEAEEAEAEEPAIAQPQAVAPPAKAPAAAEPLRVKNHAKRDEREAGDARTGCRGQPHGREARLPVAADRPVAGQRTGLDR